jgi:hypothetical protein
MLSITYMQELLLAAAAAAATTIIASIRPLAHQQEHH